ncbi:hypothetical protein DH2020_043609 [Rehmannia glutinosa]|uniref:Adenylate isopentenyltransferase n=1 Tax=Rehmannia glutinosa TaxID=99300 RepID=A0ABR0UJW7_REHGL
MGATGTGKSRLAVDLATRFNAEIINSDKIQVYKGLDIITNKVTDGERRGVRHQLIGIIDPSGDFTAEDFVLHASLAADEIIKRSQLPIIAGGSNSFIQALVDDAEFRSKYECCFLWVDVSMPVLHSFVVNRVDQMVKGGLVTTVVESGEPLGAIEVADPQPRCHPSVSEMRRRCDGCMAEFSGGAKYNDVE